MTALVAAMAAPVLRHRLMPTFSPSTRGDSMVTISGCTKKIASVSAIER